MDGHLQVIRIGLEFRSCQDSLPPSLVRKEGKKERRKEEKEEKKKRIRRVRKISLPGRIDV